MLQTVIYAITLILASSLAAQEQPQLVVSQPDFQFPRTVAGQVIEHDYILTNRASKSLRLLRANMTPPLRAVEMPALIQAGGSAAVRFRLDTSRVAGQYDGHIVLITDDPGRAQIDLEFEGEVIPQIEFDPLPAFFVSAQRGKPKSASIDIINHRTVPLKIQNVESQSNRFVTDLETIEPGEHFRLRLTVLPTAPVGRSRSLITLATADPERPLLKIPANIRINERVYTFPDHLDFGALQPAYLKGKLERLSSVAQTLMVYQLGGENFKISAQSDLPFLDLHPVRSRFGDRYQIEVTVLPDNMEVGEFSGSIVITTNDAEFPEITVPVKAVVEGPG